MKVIKHVKVPTGDILVVEGQSGLLEMLSLGDYGKQANLKADFLGLTDEIEGVEHQPMLPLSEKWVITISSQTGCSMGCKFCDVPKVGPGKNASFDDMVGQVMTGLGLHPEVEYAERINVHYARMGEPTFNWDVINSAIFLEGYFANKGWIFHPVVSTMMPATHMALREYLFAWMHLKNTIVDGDAGLQISINTTDETRREQMFAGNAMTLRQIAYHLNHLTVKGRKITLNFALTSSPIDAKRLGQLFDTEKFLCKLTPMHLTNAACENSLFTVGKGHGYGEYYPYRRVEEELKQEGFDVIVFVPSREEDDSRITCGNSILSDGK